jgi:hypothetical protein
MMQNLSKPIFQVSNLFLRPQSKLVDWGDLSQGQRRGFTRKNLLLQKPIDTESIVICGLPLFGANRKFYPNNHRVRKGKMRQAQCSN